MILLTTLLSGFLATLGTLPVLAARLGLLDHPGARSTHARPVARVGGIAILVGLLVAVGIACVRGHVAFDDVAPWLVPGGLFFAIGLVDDVRGLPAGGKFLLQGGAAAVAVLLGLRWEGAALAPFGALTFGPAGFAMTWLWIVAVVTMVNLLDGLDLITAATCAVVLGAAAGGGVGPGDGLLYAAALGAVLGFVPWNRKPARAFLGDAGTHLLGFLVATAALHEPGATHALPWVLASAPLLPGVLDIAWGLWLKQRRGVRLTQAHNQHPSQRLTHAGWSHASVAVRYAVLAVLALLLVGVVAPRWGLLGCVVVSLAILTVHLLHIRIAARGIAHRF